jgi:hypothetical protein
MVFWETKKQTRKQKKGPPRQVGEGTGPRRQKTSTGDATAFPPSGRRRSVRRGGRRGSCRSSYDNGGSWYTRAYLSTLVGDETGRHQLVPPDSRER